MRAVVLPMRLSNLRYFKRYRMEIDLQSWTSSQADRPPGYYLVRWSDDLLFEHAEVKHRSFRDELDSVLFPCFNDLSACCRLMGEIRERKGFAAEATWLARCAADALSSPSGDDAFCGTEICGTEHRGSENCGTIQAIRTHRTRANIQNIGVVPQHRCVGVGRMLIEAALAGLQRTGVHYAYLEVTAANLGAVNLYRRLGFRVVRTLYKAVDQTLNAAAP